MSHAVRRTAGILVVFLPASVALADASTIGREVAVPQHVADGAELQMSVAELLALGGRMFSANWTADEGAGRPLTKGSGAPLSSPADPLVFPRNMNRVSAPDANSCAGCHALPFGIAGGGGDFVANVFVLGQRFDFATFDPGNLTPTDECADERGLPVTLDMIANSRATLGMFGSGYIELLAREITLDLQAIRNALAPGAEAFLQSKGVFYGVLARRADGTWDTSLVEGIPAPSLASPDAVRPPSLVIRPFHQAGAVISLRQFTNNAMNHHHGIQPSERFGVGADPDGDGFTDEMTRGDVTAVTLFQAAMAVPGRVIPRDPDVEAAVLRGEQRFRDAGCASCHVEELPLSSAVFTEPNPFNPAGNLRPGEGGAVSLDLGDPSLPAPRAEVRNGVTAVAAFTDLKLHDITSGPDDPNREPLDMQQPAGSAGFFAGNSRFLTRKLWGAANEPPYFHHGRYTTMRQAILAHAGEAQFATDAFNEMSAGDRDAIIEFLKTLQVLPPGTRSLVVDEHFRPREWPPVAEPCRPTLADYVDALRRILQGLPPGNPCQDAAPGVAACAPAAGASSWCPAPDGRLTPADVTVLRRLANGLYEPSCAACSIGATPALRFVAGDVNGDAAVDIADAVLALRAATALETLTIDQVLRGDVAPVVSALGMGDGVIDVGDAVRVLRAAVGLDAVQWPLRALAVSLDAPATTEAISVVVSGWPADAAAEGATTVGCDGEGEGFDFAGDAWAVTCIIGADVVAAGDVASFGYRAPSAVDPADLTVRVVVTGAGRAPTASLAQP